MYLRTRSRYLHSHTEKDKNTLKLRRCTYVPAFLMIMGFEYSYLLFLRCQIAICEGIFLKAFFERSVIQFGMLFHSFIPIREKELFCISSLELLTYNFPQVNDGVWYEWRLDLSEIDLVCLLGLYHYWYLALGSIRTRNKEKLSEARLL